MNRYFKSVVRMLLCISCTVLNASVIQISSEEEFYAITASKPIAIEFYASWCSVCQHINKPFHTVAKDAQFKDVTFAQIDINKLTPLCKKLGIMGVPTFIYMNGGKKVHQSVGIHDIKGFAKEFRKSLRHHFGTPKSTTAEPFAQSAEPTFPAVEPQAAAPATTPQPTREPAPIAVTIPQEQAPMPVAAATPEILEELPSVDVPAPEVAHIATALATASAAALEAESPIEEIEPESVTEEDDDEEYDAPIAPEKTAPATPFVEEPEHAESATPLEAASAPTPALNNMEKAIVKTPEKPDARKIIAESNAPAIKDEQTFRAWLAEIWTAYYATCSTAAQSAYTAIATPISTIGSYCAAAYTTAYNAATDVITTISNALRSASAATLDACSATYSSCANACSACYMYGANAAHQSALYAHKIVTTCTDTLTAGYAYCTAACSTAYTALTTRKPAEPTPMQTPQQTHINNPADEQTFRAWLGEIWTAYINTITNTARAALAQISAYTQRLKPSPARPAHAESPVQATAVEAENPIEATELMMEPAEETVDVIPDIYRSDETDIQAPADDTDIQKSTEDAAEEVIEEIAPEEDATPNESADIAKATTYHDEPTYEDEEVYLIDDMSDMTFLQWMAGIIESFIHTVIAVVLWLPRTIIGLCNLLFK